MYKICLKITVKIGDSYRFGMGRRKSQKIIRSSPRNVTTGMCPECQTIGRIYIIGKPGKEHGKCPACNQDFDL
ncbi:MAG: hypothetical protein K8823_532 [Cenarchaeum symbiont of Oopsacas minuta]|nr:hypothetical protein [Cenarchaeum symbiont of Oopsacas minuta]